MTPKIYWQTLGRLFGYPECCIQDFLGRLDTGYDANATPRHFHGTGYVPCKKCDAQIGEVGEQFWVDNVIQKRRVIKGKFPNCKGDPYVDMAMQMAKVGNDNPMFWTENNRRTCASLVLYAAVANKNFPGRALFNAQYGQGGYIVGGRHSGKSLASRLSRGEYLIPKGTRP